MTDDTKPDAPLSIVERQPLAVRAAAVAAVTALVHVLVVVGVVDADTETAIVGAVDALGALVAVLWAIRAVTPNAKVIARVTTDGEVVAGDAAAAPTDTPLHVTRPRPERRVGADLPTPVVPQVAVRPELVA